ncbi:hypothetical protein FOZ63_029454 [Perkinsus olseni]|uniref:subtilisin n=1 Tax=Perkinsus olseni TaxID=32597 RepID=A0A7J6QSZ5_PEROL|nr:hypothetical protein FOZ62_025588 [Perkinsus olseni]KAF4712883.1 hypothetical protein FOZ63_029454 [Perkinsus olseni]
MSTLPLLVLFFASLVSASTPPSDTIVSIKSGSADVDIRRLPEMLRNAGVIPDQKIVSFLDTVEITALEYVHSQVVQTSASAIDSDALCKFVTVASSKLSLQSECGEDENGEVLDEFDDDLHVDDPDARYQKHWKWMDMGEVWQLALPHVTREVKVAVLDSGIDWADPDFAPLKRTLKKKSGGYLDGGWNFFTNSANLTYGEPHGTKVCKVLAAKGNNSAGIAGFAPFNVSLTLLQMIDDKRRLPLSRFLAALNMAIDLEVDVVSMSLKYEFHIRNHPLYILIYNALRSAQQHNMLLVSAAANDAREASYVYRCWFGGPRSMCVAPLSDDRTENTLAGFSNWGERVDVAAYGVGIFTDRWENGTERNFYGTSAATPVVSGIAAILLSMNIEPGMVKRLIDAKWSP